MITMADPIVARTTQWQVDSVQVKERKREAIIEIEFFGPIQGTKREHPVETFTLTVRNSADGKCSAVKTNPEPRNMADVLRFVPDTRDLGIDVVDGFDRIAAIVAAGGALRTVHNAIERELLKPEMGLMAPELNGT